MPRELRLRRRVQFYETDVAGIVHFSWFFRYMEEAEHALWRDAGLSIHPERSDIGWPRVAAACEFHRALKFEQEFDIAIRITDVTKRTISYACEMSQDGQKIATGTLKIACVAKLPDGSMKSAEIPADVADRLKPFAYRPSAIEDRSPDTA
ncbi:MAG TPA: thioesterase family protein [Vicinamibacterales bacterium]|nr:thioesterase family protein [Vicinamibacterales bacterium]